MHKVIRRGIDAGYFVETNERLVTMMIISMIVRSRVWFSPKGEKSPEEIADFITRFTLNSLLKDGKRKPGFK